MTLPTRETQLEYAQRVGAPRVVPCDIDRAGRTRGFDFVWYCRSHDYGFDDRAKALDGAPYRSIDRCPMSRLEEWRARVWEFSEWQPRPWVFVA